MAKNARSKDWITVGIVVWVSVGGAVNAGGLPMRPGIATESPHARALTALSAGLTFKLARMDGRAGGWRAAVEDVLLIARELGFPAETTVTPQLLGEAFVVMIDGEGYIAGLDPDRVLGRLLYTLAHPASAEVLRRSAAGLAILDQPLSATLATLTSSLP